MINEKINSKIILLLPLISGIFWGSGGVFVRILNSYGFDNVTIFFSRVSLVTLGLFILLILFDRKSLKIKLNDLWLFIGSGIIGVMLLNLCYNEAAFSLTLSLASVLLSLAPIFAIIFSAILFDEKITLKKIVCMIFAIIGCALVSGMFENMTMLSISYRGILFGLLSAIFWALYGIFSKIITQKGYSIFTTLFYSFLLITLFLSVFANLQLFGNFLITKPLEHGIFAVIHSLLTSILPYVLFTVSLKYIENGKASILCSSSEPLSASIFGLVMFSESLTIINLIGVIITIIAISLLIHNSE